MEAELASAEALDGPVCESGWDRNLEFLWLEITGKCNLRCKHCYAESGPTVPLRQGMSYQDWANVLGDAVAIGCKKVQFIGGEPTIHPQFMELVETASALGFDFIEVYTNGTALTPAKLASLKRLGVHVALSLYGPDAKTHEAVTQLPGSFKRMVEAMRQLVHLVIPVRVGVIAMDENRHAIESTIEFVRSLGIDDVGTDHARGVGRGPRTAHPSDPYGELCGACWRGQLAIDPSGIATPCVFSKAFRIGNAKEGLRSLLDDPALHDFRRVMREREITTAGCGPDKCGPYCKPNCNPYSNCSPKKTSPCLPRGDLFCKPV